MNKIKDNQKNISSIQNMINQCQVLLFDIQSDCYSNEQKLLKIEEFNRLQNKAHYHMVTINLISDEDLGL